MAQPERNVFLHPGRVQDVIGACIDRLSFLTQTIAMISPEIDFQFSSSAADGLCRILMEIEKDLRALVRERQAGR
jgi:hypothetical protein